MLPNIKNQEVTFSLAMDSGFLHQRNVNKSEGYEGKQKTTLY